jgi:hypothetical protein
MVYTINDNTAILNYEPVSAVHRELKAGAANERTKGTNLAKAELVAEQAAQLNELAKARPYSILYRVKKHDPL